MSFSESVKRCFSKYFRLRGRASRSEYWWFALFVFAVLMVLSLVDAMIFGADTLFSPLTSIATLVLFFPFMAVGWRRMHDIGKPGWYILLPQLISLAAFATFLFTIGIFGAIADAAGATNDARFAVDGVILITVSIVFYGATLIAVLSILWWLTRPGDEYPNRHGNPPGTPRASAPE